jgi:hypothetical protein
MGNRQDSVFFSLHGKTIMTTRLKSDDSRRQQARSRTAAPLLQATTATNEGFPQSVQLSDGMKNSVQSNIQILYNLQHPGAVSEPIPHRVVFRSWKELHGIEVRHPLTLHEEALPLTHIAIPPLPIWGSHAACVPRRDHFKSTLEIP